MLGRTPTPAHPARARLRRAAVALIAAGAAAALAGPATAGAATITTGSSTVGGTLQPFVDYEAGPSENNNLVITQSVDARGIIAYTFDDVVPITIQAPSFDCRYPFASDTTRVTCEPDNFLVQKFHRAHVALKNGSNRLAAFVALPLVANGLGASENVFVGGSGNDSMLGSAVGRDTLSGGGGNDGLGGLGGEDVLAGGSGDDSLFGGDANDELRGGTGADTLRGDAGIDTALYTERTNPVKVTIDDSANDGETGEGDRVLADVEIVSGGSGDDEIIDLVGVANAFNGGPGNDRLLGGGGPDMLLSGPGGGGANFDRLNGGSENDLLLGGPNADILAGGAGADDIFGGAGLDTVDYRGSTQPVTVDLDGAVGDDGAAGERDTVRSDVENIFGSPFSDTLTGNASANGLNGLDGDDVLEGGLGDDRLFGGNGNDTLLSKDELADSFVDCGAGSDRVDADKIDDPLNCEAKVTPAVDIGPKRARIDKRGRVKLSLHCWATAAERCTGTLKLRHRTRGKAHTVGSRRFSVASGDTTMVRVRLAAGARRALARHGLRVRAVARSRDAAGHKWTSKRTLTLVR